MTRRVYATKFESELKPTHKVVNTVSDKDVFSGTKAECLAFIHGLEYADNSNESIWFDCFLEEIKFEIHNQCDFCKQDLNKDYEYKCPTCGKEIKR